MLEAQFVTDLKEGIERALASSHRTELELKAAITKQLEVLRSKEQNLIDLAADGVLERAQIRERLGDLALERQRLEERRNGREGDFEHVLQFLRSAVELLDEVHGLYLVVDDQGRRQINQAIFEKLLIEDEAPVEPRFKEPFRTLLDAANAERADSANDEESAASSGSALEQVRQIRSLLHVEGSSKDHLVGPVGLEPTTQRLKVACSTD